VRLRLRLLALGPALLFGHVQIGEGDGEDAADGGEALVVDGRQDVRDVADGAQVEHGHVEEDGLDELAGEQARLLEHDQ